MAGGRTKNQCSPKQTWAEGDLRKEIGKPMSLGSNNDIKGELEMGRLTQIRPP